MVGSASARTASTVETLRVRLTRPEAFALTLPRRVDREPVPAPVRHRLLLLPAL